MRKQHLACENPTPTVLKGSFAIQPKSWWELKNRWVNKCLSSVHFSCTFLQLRNVKSHKVQMVHRVCVTTITNHVVFMPKDRSQSHYGFQCSGTKSATTTTNEWPYNFETRWIYYHCRLPYAKKLLPELQTPRGQHWPPILSTQPETSQRCMSMDTGPVHCLDCLLSSQLTLVSIYTAW